MSFGIHKMLDEREARYGDFEELAKLAQALKRSMRMHAGYSALQPHQREALEMVQHKIARIINGDPSYPDSWHDIIGYVERVVERLQDV